MAIVARLCYIGADLAESTAIKVEHDELRERVQLLRELRHKFEEQYVVLSGEKYAAEDQVTTLDGEEARLSQHV